ncbi:MAG TPA: hypothetical protein VNQ73_05345 [Ilumatobacter sp.]|nr:hypothetical protein [Ilumatobacter sp.]
MNVPALVDASDWPLVTVVGEGCQTAEDARVALAELTALLRRADANGERVGLVFDTDRLDRAATGVVRRWAADNAATLAAVVAGAASVVAAPAVAAGRALIEQEAAMYPFPAWCAGSADECRAWVRGMLADGAQGDD